MNLQIIYCLALLLVALLLSGCDVSLERVFGYLSGTTTNVVVLSKTANKLAPSPTHFASSDPLLVVGSSASVCVVLSGGVPLQQQTSMDSAIGKLKQGARVDVSAIADDGKKYPLTSAGQSWAMFGKIVERDEIAECYSAKCGETLAIGSKFVAVEIAATPALEIKGSYWTSTNAFDRHKARSGAPTATPTTLTSDKSASTGAAPAPSRCS